MKLTSDLVDEMQAEQKNTEVFKSKAKQDMVEMGGRLAQILGLPRSTGQIYGLLYFSYQPLSLVEICTMLGISKASTSIGTRQLATWGAVQKVWIPGERRDYYEVVEDLGQLFKISYKSLIRPRVNSSKHRLEKIKDALNNDIKMNLVEKELGDFMNARLSKLKNMHHKFDRVLMIVEKFFDN